MSDHEGGSGPTQQHINPDGEVIEVPIDTKIGKGVCLRADTFIAPNVTIEDNVIVGDKVAIGQDTIIHRGSILSDGSTIGMGCIIGKNVRIRPLATIPNCWQLRDNAIANPSEVEEPAHIH